MNGSRSEHLIIKLKFFCSCRQNAIFLIKLNPINN